MVMKYFRLLVMFSLSVILSSAAFCATVLTTDDMVRLSGGECHNCYGPSSTKQPCFMPEPEGQGCAFVSGRTCSWDYPCDPYYFIADEGQHLPLPKKNTDSGSQGITTTPCGYYHLCTCKTMVSSECTQDDTSNIPGDWANVGNGVPCPANP